MHVSVKPLLEFVEASRFLYTVSCVVNLLKYGFRLGCGT